MSHFRAHKRDDITSRKVHSLHILSLLPQKHYNLSFPSLVACVYVCVHTHVYEFVFAHAHVRMCVCVDVRLSVAPRVPTCVLLCIVFIIPASISAKLKFCTALCIYRL